MELLTQIWQSVGGPLTTLLWIYIVYVLIIGGIGIVCTIAFIIGWRRAWKTEKQNYIIRRGRRW